MWQISATPSGKSLWLISLPEYLYKGTAKRQKKSIDKPETIWRKKPLEAKIAFLASQLLLTQWPNLFRLECYAGWLMLLCRSPLELDSAVIWKDFYLLSYSKPEVLPCEDRIEIRGSEKPHHWY